MQGSRLSPKYVEFIECHCDQWTPEKIAQRLNVSLPSVCKYIKRLGKTPYYPVWNEYNKKLLAMLYKGGQSATMLANSFGVTTARMKEQLSILKQEGYI